MTVAEDLHTETIPVAEPYQELGAAPAKVLQTATKKGEPFVDFPWQF